MNSDATQELETKIAFLERHIEEQDRVILKLRQKLDVIEDGLAQLKDAVQGASGTSQELPDERPPHY